MSLKEGGKRKSTAPLSGSRLTSIASNINRVISTGAKSRLILIIVAVITVGGVAVVLQPKRTEARFCSTLNDGMSGIDSRYQDASGTSTMNEMGTWAGNMSEFSKLLRDLNEVAPSEIENDMKVVAESWSSSMDDGTKNGASAATNPLGAITGGLMGGIASAIKNGASYTAVDNYSKEHCGRGLFSGNSQSSNDIATDSSSIGVIDLSNVEKLDFKPWENQQRGFVIMTADELLLVDANTKSATKKLQLPKSLGRSPGGDSGRSYRLSINYASSISPDLRYIIGLFDATESSPSELAYYDLKEQTLKSTGVMTPKKSLRDSNIPVRHGYMTFTKTGLLEFSEKVSGDRNNSKRTSVYYDLARNEVIDGESYSAAQGRNNDVVVFDFKNKTETVIYHEYADPVQLRYKEELRSSFPCVNIEGLIDHAKLLCKEESSMRVLDITNVIDKKSEKDDPDSYDYEVGRVHYDIKDNTSITIDGKITSYALSPDLRKIAILATKSGVASLYTADLSSGKPTKVADLRSDTSSKLSLLKWQ